MMNHVVSENRVSEYEHGGGMYRYIIIYIYMYVIGVLTMRDLKGGF